MHRVGLALFLVGQAPRLVFFTPGTSAIWISTRCHAPAKGSGHHRTDHSQFLEFGFASVLKSGHHDLPLSYKYIYTAYYGNKKSIPKKHCFQGLQPDFFPPLQSRGGGSGAWPGKATKAEPIALFAIRPLSRRASASCFGAGTAGGSVSAKNIHSAGL